MNTFNDQHREAHVVVQMLRGNGPWLLGSLDLGKYFTDEFMVSTIGFKPYWIQHYQFLNYGPDITLKKEV